MAKNTLIYVVVGGVAILGFLWYTGALCKYFPATCMGTSQVMRLGYNRPTLRNQAGIQTFVHPHAQHPGIPGPYTP